MEENFSFKKIFGASWSKIANSLLGVYIIYLGVLMSLFIGMSVISLLIEIFFAIQKGQQTPLGMVIFLLFLFFLFILFFIFLKIGFLRILLDIAQERDISWRKLFTKDNFSYYLSFVWANFLKFLFILILPISIGIILSALHLNITLAFVLQLVFVLPATIYLVLRLQFVSLALLDKKLSGWEAVKEGWRLTQGKELKILAFDILIFLISLVLLITFIGGFFIKLFALQANVYFYEALNNREKIEGDTETTLPENDVEEGTVAPAEEQKWEN